MRVYECEKYVCTRETVSEMLERYGVAVIPSVLSDAECQEMLDGMWAYLAEVSSTFETPIDRDKPETWREMRKLFPKHSMLLQHFSIGQAEMNWKLRQNPKLVDIFSTIWDTPNEELLVSFDGASFHFPPELVRYGWFKGSGAEVGWLHCDQALKGKDVGKRTCIQSWVTANHVEEGDATLVFLEGSHAHHAAFAEQLGDGASTDDWYKLTEEDMRWYTNEKGCARVHVKCPAGSLVLWDSRTIHSGTEPERARKKAKLRCVSYLCYTPRRWATPSIIRKRVKAFQEGRTTTHWPHRPKLFPKTPRTYGAPVPNVGAISQPLMSALGRRLVGF